MAGQTQIPGVLVFDVTDLQISSPGGIWEPMNIVATNQAFDLGTEFHGGGFVWQWLKAAPIGPVSYQVSYFAEGIGFSASEVDLGSRVANLTAADNYSFIDTRISVPAGTLQPGVYRIACLVTFPGLIGLTGFFETLVIQIYQA